MPSLTANSTERDWLDQHAGGWVDAGLISEDQAAAIRSFEHLDEPTQAPRLTVIAEAATYLGSVIAVAGGAAIVGPNWDEFGLIGQLVLALAIAAVGFVVGARLVAEPEAGMVRLGSFLWVIGTGGLAIGAGAVVNAIDPADEGWYGVVIGAPVLLIGAWLWRNLDRPLQLLTAVVGLFVTQAGVRALVEVSEWVASPVTWLASLAFGALASANRLRPRLAALAVSAVGLMTGAMIIGPESEELASIAAVVTAAGIVAFALVDRSWPLVAIGLVAFFIGMTSLMQNVLQGMASRLVAVVGGLVVVAAIAVRAQRTNATGPPGQR